MDTLFERESNFIREQAYFNFCLHQDSWNAIRDTNDKEVDCECPEADRAFHRAYFLLDLANFLNPDGHYNFYERYHQERYLKKVWKFRKTD